MAWNRPKEREQGIGNRGAGKSPFRGLIAGAIVVIGAAVAAWWIWPEGESAGETPPPQARQRIKEVTPAKGARGETAKSNLVAKADGVSTNGFYRDADGTLRRPGGMRVVEGPVIQGKPPKSYITPMYHTQVEMEILSLLTMQLGERRFAERRYTPQFEKDLRASMKLGDQIKEGDSDKVKEEKLAVWEAKQDLIKRMDRGEKLKDIIKESQAELKRYADYRQNLLAELDVALRDESATEEYVNDFISAANQIFKDNGMRPISAKGTLLRRKIMLDAKAKARAKERTRQNEQQ